MLMLRKFIILLTLLLGSVQVQARTYEMCFEEASDAHEIPLIWLYAIAFTESSFWSESESNNRNGSNDFGLMQVNTIWRDEAERLGYDWEEVKNDPCTNIMFGAHIIRTNWVRTNNFSRAIGAYHAGLSQSQKARQGRTRYYYKVKSNREVAQDYLHRLQVPIHYSTDSYRQGNPAANSPLQPVSTPTVVVDNDIDEF